MGALHGIASLQKRRTIQHMKHAAPVVIALKRPPGYADVHPELVIEDAMRPEWSYQFLRDEGAAVIISVDRPEDYERSSASEVAKEAVRPTWPSWSLAK